MLDLTQIAGRGLGLVAAQPIAAGEVVLSEGPLMLYPQHSMSAEVCHHCLRMLGAAGAPSVRCGECAAAGFCSAGCASAAATDAGSHCPLVCAAIAACNFAGLSDDQRTALQYLMRASSLLVCAQRGDGTAQTRCAQLQALTPRRPPPPSHAAVDSGVESLEVRELHGRLQHALAASGAAAPGLSDAAGLLAREEANSYGVMAPPGPDGQRRLRGGAVYAAASRINHECLPNVARFDAFDAAHPGAAPGANTAVHFRALHALPPGEELTQSYFPLTWSYQERQRRCAEHYGFACSCPRCREEASWPDGVRADRDAGAGEDGLAAHPGSSDDEDGGTMQDAGAATNPADAAYIHVFLFKYVCPRPGCEGTMAPAAPRALTMSCNVCGGQRSDADFLAELEQDMRAGQ